MVISSYNYARGYAFVYVTSYIYVRKLNSVINLTYISYIRTYKKFYYTSKNQLQVYCYYFLHAITFKEITWPKTQEDIAIVKHSTSKHEVLSNFCALVMNHFKSVLC